MSLKKGFGVGFRWVVGGGLSFWRMREKGREWGGCRQSNRQVNAHALVKAIL